MRAISVYSTSLATCYTLIVQSWVQGTRKLKESVDMINLISEDTTEKDSLPSEMLCCLVKLLTRRLKSLLPVANLYNQLHTWTKLWYFTNSRQFFMHLSAY